MSTYAIHPAAHIVASTQLIRRQLLICGRLTNCDAPRSHNYGNYVHLIHLRFLEVPLLIRGSAPPAQRTSGVAANSVFAKQCVTS
jgi:hypothetical protein